MLPVRRIGRHGEQAQAPAITWLNTGAATAPP